MPSLIGTSANPDAMPVANGLTVEPEHTDAGPEQDHAAPTIAS